MGILGFCSFCTTFSKPFKSRNCLKCLLYNTNKRCSHGSFLNCPVRPLRTQNGLHSVAEAILPPPSPLFPSFFTVNAFGARFHGFRVEWSSPPPPPLRLLMPLEEDHEDMAGGGGPSAFAGRDQPPRPPLEDEAGGGESIASPLAANRNGQL